MLDRARSGRESPDSPLPGRESPGILGLKSRHADIPKKGFMYLRRGCDGMMVAVGFIPRTGLLGNLRVAARRLKTWDAIPVIHFFRQSRCDECVGLVDLAHIVPAVFPGRERGVGEDGPAGLAGDAGGDGHP